MPRTFSLRHLLVGIALFCVLCAFVANFPQASLVCVIVLSLLAPTAVAWLVLLRYSKEPIILTFNVVSGATVFFVFTMLLLPSISFGPVLDYMAFAIPPAFGAVIFCGLFLDTDVRPTRKEQ